jgi:hypothetical protein
MTADVTTWRVFLCAVGALNIFAWSLSGAALRQRRPHLDAEAYAARRLQLLFSAGYVFGCAFRSAFPVYDVQRMVLIDSWLSSVIVGRSVATLAELCFVAQWALLLREISRRAGSATGNATSMLLVPLIAVAEVFSWYSVLTTSNLGHVVEESLWGLNAALFTFSLVTIWPRCEKPLRPILAAWCIAGLAYVAFMFLVDVPMYWSRWLADEASGRNYLGVVQGLLDVSRRWVVSHQWEAWKSEVVWMSLYFSVAVWFSIALIHAPIPCRAVRR